MGEKLLKMGEKLVIVDVGGVVLDNHPARAAAFQNVWQGLIADSPPAVQEQMRRATPEQVGNAMRGAQPADAVAKLAALCGIDDAALLVQMQEKAKKAYREQRDAEPDVEPAFAGIAGALATLKKHGYSLLAMSRKDVGELRASLKAAGVDRYFDDVESTHHQEKTSEGLVKLMAELQVLPKNVMLIGDTKSDILAAQGAGIRALHANWAEPQAAYGPMQVSQPESLPLAVELRFGKPVNPGSAGRVNSARRGAG